MRNMQRTLHRTKMTENTAETSRHPHRLQSIIIHSQIFFNLYYNWIGATAMEAMQPIIFKSMQNHNLSIRRINHPKMYLQMLLICWFNSVLYYCIFPGNEAIELIASSISLNGIHNSLNKTKKYDLSWLMKKIVRKLLIRQWRKSGPTYSIHPWSKWQNVSKKCLVGRSINFKSCWFQCTTMDEECEHLFWVADVQLAHSVALLIHVCTSI